MRNNWHTLNARIQNFITEKSPTRQKSNRWNILPDKSSVLSFGVHIEEASTFSNHIQAVIGKKVDKYGLWLDYGPLLEGLFLQDFILFICSLLSKMDFRFMCVLRKHT